MQRSLTDGSPQAAEDRSWCDRCRGGTETQERSGGIVSTYRAFEVAGQRQFRLVERQRREPLPGEVRLRVHACGVCHSDVLAVEGQRADPSKPIVPGHEIGRASCRERVFITV